MNRKLHEELKAVADSPRLASLTAQTVGKSLQMLVERAESMAPGGKLLTLQLLPVTTFVWRDRIVILSALEILSNLFPA